MEEFGFFCSYSQNTVLFISIFFKNFTDFNGTYSYERFVEKKVHYYTMTEPQNVDM